MSADRLKQHKTAVRKEMKGVSKLEPEDWDGPFDPSPPPVAEAKEAPAKRHGAAHDLIDRIELLRLGKAVQPMPGSMVHNGQRPNTYIMRVTLELLLELLRQGGDPGARAEALEWLKTQKRDGNCCRRQAIEQGSADPHWNYFTSSHEAILLTALERGDEELAQGYRHLVESELNVLQLCSLGDVAAYPGTRAKSDPPMWGVASAVLAEARGHRHPKTDNKGAWWLAPRLMRELHDRHGIALPDPSQQRQAGKPEPHREYPYLRMPMTVHRWPAGYQASIERPDPWAPWIPQPVDWVRVEIAGMVDEGHARVRPVTTYGRAWQTPPPPVPAGAQRIEVGRRAA